MKKSHDFLNSNGSQWAACSLQWSCGHQAALSASDSRWSRSVSCYKSSSSVLNRSELNWNPALPEGDWLLVLPHQENLSSATSSFAYPLSLYPSLSVCFPPLSVRVFMTALCSTSLWSLGWTYTYLVHIKVPLCRHNSFFKISCMAYTFSFPSLPLLYSPALQFCFWYYLQDWPTAQAKVCACSAVSWCECAYVSPCSCVRVLECVVVMYCINFHHDIVFMRPTDSTNHNLPVTHTPVHGDTHRPNRGIENELLQRENGHTVWTFL